MNACSIDRSCIGIHCIPVLLFGLYYVQNDSNSLCSLPNMVDYESIRTTVVWQLTAFACPGLAWVSSIDCCYWHRSAQSACDNSSKEVPRDAVYLAASSSWSKTTHFDASYRYFGPGSTCEMIYLFCFWIYTVGCRHRFANCCADEMEMTRQLLHVMASPCTGIARSMVRFMASARDEVASTCNEECRYHLSTG